MTCLSNLSFEERGDVSGKPFFAFCTNASNIRNVSKLGFFNINSFLRPIIPITKLNTGTFTFDLTPRDDVVLAFLSLLLLLAIEGLVATLLLRTRDGSVSNFGFSVKQTVELLRDFSFRKVYSKPHKAQHLAPRRINKKLVIIAVSILFLTFAVETTILFLTNPTLSKVTNKKATFRIMQPVTPKWDKVYHHFRASWNRPCRSGRLTNGVDQMETRINICITSDNDGAPPQLFQQANDTTSATFISRLHQYGADHDVTIAGKSNSYYTRAYFSLTGSHRKLRVMAIDQQHENEEQLIDAVHQLLVAYLFSAYRRETKDEAMNLERLNALEHTFSKENNDNIFVLPGKRYQQQARVYNTTFQGILPTGIAAFHVIQNAFGGAAALLVHPGNVSDLFVDDAKVRAEEEYVWGESIRWLNWVTLSFLVVIAILTLSILRFKLNPSSTAEIAGVFVKEQAGAILSRSPVEVADYELRYLRLDSLENREHADLPVYGAETENHGRVPHRDLNDFVEEEYVVGAGTHLHACPSGSEYSDQQHDGYSLQTLSGGSFSLSHTNST